jgi:hypothetical protein
MSRALTSLCLSVVLIALAAAPAAGAGSLVFVKNGNAWVSQQNGSKARQVTFNSKNYWAWPSESNTGKIAVAGGPPGVNTGGGTETSGSSQIYAFDQQGRKLVATPVTTPGSYSSPAEPTYVDHFRVSPGGGTVAYNVIGCCGASGETTFTSPLRSGGGWTQFQDDYVDPGWVDGSMEIHTSNALALTHNGPTVTFTQPQYAIFDASDSSNNLGWYGDADIPDGWDYQASFTHNTQTLALFMDDAPDHGGTVQNVRIQLETVHPDLSETNDCTFTRPATQYSQPHNREQASLSFSSDGSLMAWGQRDGIYEANVSNPSNCTAVKNSIHRIVAGGAMPSFGAAPLSAPLPPPNTTISTSQVSSPKHQATFSFTGSGGVAPLHFMCQLDSQAAAPCRSPKTYTQLKAGSHAFRVRAVDARGKTDPTPATKTFSISR